MATIERIEIAPSSLRGAVGDLIAAGGRMQMAYAWYPTPETLELRYVGDRPDRKGLIVWSIRPDRTMQSVSGLSPLMSWYEREMSDLFGIAFEGQPEPMPLVLHPGARPQMPPLDPSYPGATSMPYAFAEGGFPDVAGDDVQQLPFGPIRADVVESVKLVFFYIGEHILHLHPKLFFKHRGMEKRFAGLPLAKATVLAERVSGVGSFAHALAFCQAVEVAADCLVPDRALMLRSLLAELERIYNHLHYLGHLADATTLKVGQADGRLLEERAKQINGRLTGSRFLRGTLKPGGLRRDIEALDWLGSALEALREEAAAYAARLDDTSSFLDRLMTTGQLSRQVAFDQGATGPIERASGLDRDLRRDYPYAAYARLPVEVPVRQDGDAYSRFQVRVAELADSIALVQRALLLLPEGPISAPCIPPPESEGLGWCESPRGGLFYAVHFDRAGEIARVKIKSPSFSNWRVFPFTVHDSNMMDYAINEASFGLTVAGCDR
jgi:formate hydrogenlyase subunit 5